MVCFSCSSLYKFCYSIFLNVHTDINLFQLQMGGYLLQSGYNNQSAKRNEPRRTPGQEMAEGPGTDGDVREPRWRRRTEEFLEGPGHLSQETAAQGWVRLRLWQGQYRVWGASHSARQSQNWFGIFQYTVDYNIQQRRGTFDRFTLGQEIQSCSDIGTTFWFYTLWRNRQW
jgi:hypothetical protein